MNGSDANRDGVQRWLILDTAKRIAAREDEADHIEKASESRGSETIKCRDDRGERTEPSASRLHNVNVWLGAIACSHAQIRANAGGDRANRR